MDKNYIVDKYGNKYEVVTEVPVGYLIWNIGKNMVPGYLPFCRLKAIQPFEGGRSVETDTLKAIKCAGAGVILTAIGYGEDTSADMQTFIKKHLHGREWKYLVKRYKAAIPYMRAIGM